VQTGDSVMIGGFIITGEEPKQVLLRARGPSLADEGVSGVLANPVLTLYDAAQDPIASNDDWESGDQAQAIEDLGAAPTDPRESALLVILNPGAYTAIVNGFNNTTGVSIVEMFVAD
jgi:hypothetical protein